MDIKSIVFSWQNDPRKHSKNPLQFFQVVVVKMLIFVQKIGPFKINSPFK